MTLKSLHTQYVKPIRKMTVMLTLLLAVVSLRSDSHNALQFNLQQEFVSILCQTRLDE